MVLPFIDAFSLGHLARISCSYETSSSVVLQTNNKRVRTHTSTSSSTNTSTVQFIISTVQVGSTGVETRIRPCTRMQRYSKELQQASFIFF